MAGLDSFSSNHDRAKADPALLLAPLFGRLLFMKDTFMFRRKSKQRMGHV